MKKRETKTTSEMFRWLCETPNRWRDAGLKEYDRKYYLRLWRSSRLPDQVTMERQIRKARYKPAGIRHVANGQIVEATWNMI